MGVYRLSEEFYARWGAGIDEAALLYALRMIRDAGYERAVFFEREKPFEDAEWIEWARSNEKLFFLGYRSDGTLLAVVWFDRFSDTQRQAYAHFCTLPAGQYEEFVRGGRLLLAFIVMATNIVQFLALLPACYRHALKLAYDLGYEKIARLENALFVHGKESDAILAINNITRLEV